MNYQGKLDSPSYIRKSSVLGWNKKKRAILTDRRFTDKNYL